MAAVTATRAPIPVTLLSGFLGSGKTTLLKHILENREGLRCAVIVNDMAALNIDAALVKGTKLLQREEKLVQLQNGCICCTLREDLLHELRQLARSGAVDYVVVESTGVSEPQQVAETFFFEFDDEGTLNELAKLDTCVTVVDASTFYRNLHSLEALSSREDDVAEDDERDVATLLIDQIEFADVILLNKCDLVTPAQATAVEQLLRKLNVQAKVLRTVRSVVPLPTVLNTGLFSLAKAETSAGWLQDIRGAASKPETLEYGIASFVYRARRPFHPKRLHDFLCEHFMVREEVLDAHDHDEAEEGEEGEKMEEEEEEKMEEEEEEEEDEEDGAGLTEEEQISAMQRATTERFGNIVRAKGFVWLGAASRHARQMELSQAGFVLTVSPGARWFAATPEEEWPEEEDVRASIREDFSTEEPHLGDRRQEIVVIGQNLNEPAIVAALNECLLTPEEYELYMRVAEGGASDAAVEGEAKAAEFDDPFVAWPEMEEEEEDEEGEGSEDEEGEGSEAEEEA